MTSSKDCPVSAKESASEGEGRSTEDPSPHGKKAIPSFPVAGIGASAGGLEALTQLLLHLDSNSGIAYVVVQHLAADHHSFLSEILSKSSSLPVREASNGMMLEANHIYVMPPNVKISLKGNHLKLSPRSKPKGSSFCPIDVFFKSLATTCRERAIGIILSGSGSDGAKGIAEIASVGGVTLAQDPRSAKFASMPEAALAMGADVALEPAAMAAELLIIARTLQADSTASRKEAKQHEPVNYASILRVIDAAHGMDFSAYKKPTLQRRILRRMTINNMRSTDDYTAYLKENPDEISRLYEDILVKVTSFFRVPESFAALKENLSRLILAKRPSEKIRIWVPGCASGEEAYTIAICILELLEDAKLSNKIEIFASDLSDTALAIARQGRYHANISEHVSPERLRRFFLREADGYRVCQRIRDCCIFAKQNVVRDPPFSKLDLISCRNLMIYLSPTLQRRVLTAFHFALTPQGFLSLGHAETIGSAADLFETVDKANKIYVRKEAPRNSYVSDFTLDSLGVKALNASPYAERPYEPTTTTKRLDVRTSSDRAILSLYVPPGVVVNEHMDVLQVRGDTSRFLMLPQGEPSTNLFKMCRPGLLVELRRVLHEAAQHGKPVKKVGWVQAGKKGSQSLIIDVLAFVGPNGSAQHFVILFGDDGLTGPKAAPPVKAEASEAYRFERELAATKEYLNSIIEKEQATNEELKAAGEEILSANEELQSANEEMATAKEESQATNEELTTVNDELHTRNQELGRVNSDLANLFGSVQIPIVMLSENLAIRRFTPAAGKVFGLSANDQGCSLGDTPAVVAFAGLVDLVREVLDTLQTKDQEVQDRHGRWYSLRIKPYRTEDNKIDGTIIVLIDIDSLKKSFQQLKVAYDYADIILQTAPVPVLVLDTNFSITSANQAFYKNFNITVADPQNIKIFDLGNGEWNFPELHELLEIILPNSELVDNFVIDHKFKSLGRRIMRISARLLAQQGEQPAKILLAIQDLTEDKRTEEGIRVAKEAAESSNHAKSDFLANMSHEIRTPLGAILGYSEILANPELSKVDGLQAVTRIRRNVEQLTELIDQILDIAKIEAGKFEVECVKFALLPELAETFALLESRAQGKGLSFEVNFHDDIPDSITSCPKRLRQILFNIIGNALKFTEDGGVRVDVRLLAAESGKGAKKLYFAVRDTGCGLSGEQQLRLFQPFSQADSSVTRKFGGSGLGLLLARQLASALGGDVVLEESLIGKGSTFVISIDAGPLGQVRMLNNLSQEALNQRKDKIADWFGVNQRLAGKRGLLVEDGPDNQAVISHFLTASGASVKLAADGAQAVTMAQNAYFDFVLMDVQMPVLDGYEATKRLRTAGIETPIIALTAHAMQGERERCLAIGCDDYISKPTKPNTLIETIERVLKKKS